MPGFLISNFKYNPILKKEYEEADYIYQEKMIDDWSVQLLALNKFADDKCLFENEKYLVVTDGVILNRKSLCTKAQVSTLGEYISWALDCGNHTFWKEFRGSFSGAVYIKEEKKWISYVNQMGDRLVFHWQHDEKFILGSSLQMVTQVLKLNQCNVTINHRSVYNILTYSYMQGNETIINEIFRIEPGCYIVWNNNEICENTYHKFDNINVCNLSENEIIEKIDQLFRAAVARQFEKDKEYGYKHFASLSSGLDARMCVWVARDLGYDVDTCTFSESGFVDAVVAEKMASYLRCNHMFKPLDDGKCMFNLEKSSILGHCMTAANHTMHAMQMMERLNLKQYGMLHTGQVGGAILSSHYKNSNHAAPIAMAKPYSTFLAEKNTDENYKKYDNMDQLLLYTRSFRCSLTSQAAHYNYMEMFSPFCDIDFFEFCMSIPFQYRANHYIYKKWIMKKYPKAAEFVWGSTGVPVSMPDKKLKIISFKKKVKSKILRMVKRNKVMPSRNIMTPYDFWLSEFSDIREYYDDIFHRLIDQSHLDDSLREDMRRMYFEGKAREKIQVLTVLINVDYLLSKSKKDGKEFE